MDVDPIVKSPFFFLHFQMRPLMDLGHGLLVLANRPPPASAGFADVTCFFNHLHISLLWESQSALPYVCSISPTISGAFATAFAY